MGRRSHVEPNVVSYSAAISACEKGQQWEDALSLLDDVQGSFLVPDVVSFNAAISACEVCGRSPEAGQLKLQMRQTGVAPDIATLNASVGMFEPESQRVLFDSVIG